MTRREHLLTILAEECAEVSHRVSKALRFGLTEKLKGQPYTNAELILNEYTDLIAVMEMLNDDGAFPPAKPREEVLAAIAGKKKRVEEYMGYSKECGTLDA